MTIKQYKNRLGIYEPYQSGGGGDKKVHNEHFYSTPNYMSFMDAMYMNKYGKINQNGGFDLSHKLHHYFKTLSKWTNNLSQGGIHDGGMIVNDINAHRNAEKILNIPFNVYSANKVGGRNKLLMKGGGNNKNTRLNNNNVEPFSLIVKGTDEFKPVLFLS